MHSSALHERPDVASLSLVAMKPSQLNVRMASKFSTPLVLGRFVLLCGQLSKQGAGLLPNYSIGAGVTSRSIGLVSAWALIVF